jgi:hypothetical protein
MPRDDNDEALRDMDLEWDNGLEFVDDRYAYAHIGKYSLLMVY